MSNPSYSPKDRSTLIDWSKVNVTGYSIKETELYPEFEHHLFQQLFGSTWVLIQAVYGEDADAKRWMPGFLHFVETPFGMNLAVSASEARQRGPRSWTAFCASVRLPGWDIIRAVAVWQNAFPSPSSIVALQRRKAEGPLTSAEADYYDRLVRSEIPAGLENLEAAFREMQRISKAEEKRNQRGKKPRKADEVKTVIARDWVTLALWCRSTKGILELYGWASSGTAHEFERYCKKIKDAISDLGFSCSRRPEFEKVLTDAENALMMKLMASR